MGAGAARLWAGSPQRTPRCDKDLSGHDPGVFPGVPNDQKAESANEVRAVLAFALLRAREVAESGPRPQLRNLAFPGSGPRFPPGVWISSPIFPADDAERKARLDYIEYWNTDSTKTYRIGGNTSRSGSTSPTRRRWRSSTSAS